MFVQFPVDVVHLRFDDVQLARGFHFVQQEDVVVAVSETENLESSRIDKQSKLITARKPYHEHMNRLR